MKAISSAKGRRPRLTPFRRGFALLILAACIPACSYKKSGPYTPPGGGGAPPGSTILMSDGFFPFPGTNWTTPSVSGGATAASVFTGSEYHLEMQAPSTRATAASALTRTTAAFNSHQVSISVDIDTSAQSSLADLGSVLIEDSSTHSVLAEADFNASTLMLTFHIGATAFAPIALTTGVFYRLTFSVNASDMATWKLGTGTPTAAVAFSPVMVDLALDANWAAGTPIANPAFDFRNALVTTP